MIKFLNPIRWAQNICQDFLKIDEPLGFILRDKILQNYLKSNEKFW